MNSIARNFPKIANKYDYDCYFPDILEGKRVKIVSWAVYLINNFEDIELRGLKWKNSPFHMIGQHQNCSHGPLPPSHRDWEEGKTNLIAFQKMQNFFNNTVKFIKACEFRNTTQCNESLNNLISMLAPKRLHFASSYNVRALLAGGLYNDPHFFSQLIIDLDLTKYVPKKSMEEIISFEKEREKEILKKRTSQYRDSKNQYRKQKYSKNEPEGDYNEDKKDILFD